MSPSETSWLRRRYTVTNRERRSANFSPDPTFMRPHTIYSNGRGQKQRGSNGLIVWDLRKHAGFVRLYAPLHQVKRSWHRSDPLSLNSFGKTAAMQLRSTWRRSDFFVLSTLAIKSEVSLCVAYQISFTEKARPTPEDLRPLQHGMQAPSASKYCRN